MNHNLETVKLKLRAYNTHRGRLEAVFKELESLEKELEDLYKGDDFSAHILIQHVLRKSGEEILGEKELTRNV